MPEPAANLPPCPAPASVTSLSLLAALMVLLGSGWFYNGAFHNQNARLNAIFSFGEAGQPDYLTFRMDRFLPDPKAGFNTVDWSAHGGHYYANKAPGTLLAGALIYWPLARLQSAFGVPAEQPPWPYVHAWLINLGVSVLPLALAAWAFCRLLGRHSGISATRPLELTLWLFFGTLLWPYSTQLWGHCTAAACWVGVAVALADQRAPHWARAGLWAGLAVLVEYLSALGVMVLLGLAALAGVARWRATSGSLATRLKQAARPLGALALGGAGPALIHLVYHYLCFGAPLSTANAFQNPEWSQAGRALGMFGWPQAEALWGLSFASFRGLFYSAPWLLLALPGHWYWWRSGQQRRLWLFSVTFTVLHWLVNAGFNGWHGGWTVGARYLIPTLPFMVLSLVYLSDWPGWRWLWRLGGLYAVIGMLAVTAVNPLATDDQIRDPNPFRDRLILLARGQLTPQFLPIRLDREPSPATWRWCAFNLGEWLGLRGLSTLWPLLALQVSLLVFWRWRGWLTGYRFTGASANGVT